VRTLVPGGGAIPFDADDLALVEKVTDEIEGYPPRARRRMRLLLFAIEFFPLLDGRGLFTSLDPKRQHEYLESAGRHKRSPLRRLVVSYLKQLVYANYLSQPQIEDAIGYRYECARPRDGVEARPEDQIHH